MAHQHSQRGNVDLDGLPAVVAAHHPLAMVYGGGGVFGIAYTAGVATGLAEAGVPVATAPALGTSAGSWTASALALGVTYDDFATISSPRVPTRRPGVLADLARELFGEQTHPLVSVSAVCVRTRRRHILDGGRYPLADLVAASSAVPGLLPPHRIDGRLYVDGGMWSATSVDAAAEADHVIVVAPLAGPVLGPVGHTAGLLLERELRRWVARHPESTVTLVRPDRTLARLAGRHPLALFDDGRAADVHALAYDQGLRVGEELGERRLRPA
jgi:NTE family protein